MLASHALRRTSASPPPSDPPTLGGTFLPFAFFAFAFFPLCPVSIHLLLRVCCFEDRALIQCVYAPTTISTISGTQSDLATSRSLCSGHRNWMCARRDTLAFTADASAIQHAKCAQSCSAGQPGQDATARQQRFEAGIETDAKVPHPIYNQAYCPICRMHTRLRVSPFGSKIRC